MNQTRQAVDQVRCGCGRPADTHLRAEHLLQASVHFFFLNELATVGLRDALTHGGAEVGFLLKQAQRRVLYQVFGVCPRLSRDLGKLRFLLGCEVSMPFKLRENGNDATPRR